MSLRTSLSRLARRDPAAPTLRERLSATAASLAATKERAGRALAVGRVVMKAPEPAPPPVDRLALVNYATWLFMERRLVCAELYPHMGGRADRFVLAHCAAERFHFPGRPNGFPGVGDSPSGASTRAVKVLDMVGVDWRADLAERRQADLDGPSMQDTGARPRLPHGWPRTDAALLEALDDLTRLDAAQGAMYVSGSDREGDTVPGYEALEEARGDALDRLADERAESLIGLQAKAKALLTRSVVDMGEAPFEAIAQSLARNLLGIPQSAIEPRPDPVFAAIEESRRLAAAHADALAGSGASTGADPSDATHAALWAHWDGVVLKTVPTTARGCAALARCAVDTLKGSDLAAGRDAVLALIACSPLL